MRRPYAAGTVVVVVVVVLAEPDAAAAARAVANAVAPAVAVVASPSTNSVDRAATSRHAAPPDVTGGVGAATRMLSRDPGRCGCTRRKFPCVVTARAPPAASCGCIDAGAPPPGPSVAVAVAVAVAVGWWLLAVVTCLGLGAPLVPLRLPQPPPFDVAAGAVGANACRGLCGDMGDTALSNAMRSNAWRPPGLVASVPACATAASWATVWGAADTSCSMRSRR